MAELTPEDVYQIALRLLDARKLTQRQFTCWHYARYRGLSFRDAAEVIREEEQYEVSHFTVMMDSRYAHEIVIQACQDATEGHVRFGHTVAAGSEAWFAEDSTLRLVALKRRGYVKKNPMSAQNRTLSIQFQ